MCVKNFQAQPMVPGCCRDLEEPCSSSGKSPNCPRWSRFCLLRDTCDRGQNPNPNNPSLAPGGSRAAKCRRCGNHPDVERYRARCCQDANWTSWHLDSTWRGSAPRQDDFRNDDTLPPGFHQVLGTDYSGSGFDRGHMCPSADRTSTIEDNSATFLMTNMVPQGPGNNQGPWAALENSLRTFLPDNELYILSGGQGVGGIGSNGPLTVLASGVTVPAKTWKAGLILPVGDNDVSRVDNNTRIIAVIMPND